MLASQDARKAIVLVFVTLLPACGPEARPETESPPAAEAVHPNNMARALEGGGTVFVIRPSELTAEQGAWTARVRDADYVFTSLESGPWDMPGMNAFLQGMQQEAAYSPNTAKNIPVLLRIPPIHELGLDSARARVEEALRVGVSGIIFPHILSAEEMAQPQQLLGSNGWPTNPQGSAVAVHMIEDRSSVDMAPLLVSTPGVKVILVGPMSLHSSYQDDSVAVENAIQSVLALCKAQDVACGITAVADDVVKRVQQGFRFLVVREPEVLAAGKAAVSRP
jgi:hypothetical protein